jgi:NAD(P)-dependent dehydrogenase (short-subunit alcohol dehydrogenase family)
MKTVLVTGASTGIGRATALRLDRAGWKVYAGVRSEEAGAALAGLASEHLEPVIVDVADAEQVAAAGARVGATLDGLVNNAGIAVGGPLEVVAIDDLRHQLEINVVGQVAMTQAVLPALRAARGRIVFTSSVSGITTPPFVGPYAASKHAIEAIAGCLRAELMPWGIEVTVVGPGSVATPIWDKGKQQAEEATAALSPAHRELYGPTVEAFGKIVVTTGERGVPPDDVARVVETALTASKPKTRVTVGRDAKGQIVLARVLSPRTFNRIVRRLMKLPRTAHGGPPPGG